MRLKQGKSDYRLPEPVLELHSVMVHCAGISYALPIFSNAMQAVGFRARNAMPDGRPVCVEFIPYNRHLPAILRMHPAPKKAWRFTVRAAVFREF